MAVVRRDQRSFDPHAAFVGVGMQRGEAIVDADAPAAPPRTPGDAGVAASPTQPAHLWAMLLGLGFIGAGLYVAFVFTQTMAVGTFRASSQMSIFAGIVVFTAAVERLLEPFTRWLPGRAAQHRYDWALAAMEDGAGSTLAAAKARADLDQAKADKAVLTWGLATGLATALAASSGLYLLHMIAENPQWSAVPTWVDALVTGLIIGSGTKPVHDFIARVQKAKEDAGA